VKLLTAGWHANRIKKPKLRIALAIFSVIGILIAELQSLNHFHKTKKSMCGIIGICRIDLRYQFLQCFCGE
jgi:hypothetical protein